VTQTLEVREVELRCNQGAKRLFGKMRLTGDKPAYTDDNEIEVVCANCRKSRALQDPTVARVYHYFNFLGELTRSAEEHSGAPEARADTRGDG
jgi:hypothetical protein